MFAWLRLLLGRGKVDPVMAGYEKVMAAHPDWPASRYELALARFAPEKLTGHEKARVERTLAARPK